MGRTLAFATIRRKTFRDKIKKTENDGCYNNLPKRLNARQKFFRKSIETAKLARTKLKTRDKPLYNIVGR